MGLNPVHTLESSMELKNKPKQCPALISRDSDSFGAGPFKTFFPGDWNVWLGQKATA